MGMNCGNYGINAWLTRRYWTKEERRACLQEYADGLENELKAVRERIDELKADQA